MTPETHPTPRQHRLSAHRAQRPIATIGYVLTLALAMTLFFAWGSAQAQESTGPEESPSAWWMRGWEGEAPSTQDSAPVEAIPTPRLADEFDPDTWTKLVFQSYFQGNWDIMISSNDETTMSTLVAHPAADIRPRFGWEAKQVVFVSNRDGNWEIYVINADGTGLKRLTQNSSVDTMPSWSPDGSRIAFSSNRSGQYQIYTMNPDGSDVVQLTSLPKDQVAPSWSKDNRIAWSQADQTTGILWIMNGDGSNQHAITPALPYLTNPIWSQDSVQLAFSYAAQTDGAYDVATIADNGSGMKLVAGSGSPNVDLIPTDWDMDPGESWYRILITELQDAEGSLRVNARVLLQGGSTREMFYSPGKGFVDFEVADRTPPVSQINPLPALTRADGYNVTWSVHDIGPSGIWRTELQSRVLPDGAWESSYFSALSPPYAYLQGQSGTSMAFRARASDYAGNVEAWPANGAAETQTSFFSRKLTGTILDNRGTPLAQASIAITPAATTGVSTNASGTFDAGLSATGWHTFQIDPASGFGDQSFYLPVNTDRSVALYTSPSDNVIQNGTFEAAIDMSTEWITPYAHPHSTELSHLGSYGAQLGVDCDPVLCLQNIQPELLRGKLLSVMDSADNLHLVWQDSQYGIDVGSFHYRIRSSDGVWSSTQDIPFQGSLIALLLDSHDGLHLISLEFTQTISWDIYHRSRSVNGQWVNHGIVTTIWAKNPVALMGPDDVIHLAFSAQVTFPQMGIWHQAIPITGAPSAPEQVTFGNWGSTPAVVALAISKNGTLHLIHSDAYTKAFFYWIRPSGAAWYQAELPMLDGNTQAIQDLWVDSNNQVHLLWSKLEDPAVPVFYSVRSASGVWSPYNIIANQVATLSHVEDRQGGVHLIGCQYESGQLSTTRAAYRRFLPEGIATDPLVFRDPGLDYNPCSQGALLFDSSNQPHFLWTFRPSYSQPEWWLYSSPSIGSSTETVDTLSQVVTIPADMHNPTLSFMHQVWFAQSPSTTKSRLSVLIAAADQVTQTEVFSATSVIDWKLGWADLQPWAGQTVTVTFSIAQSAGEPYLRAYLDDIALGSWSTPYVGQVDPASLTPGVPAVITVTGQNFINPVSARLTLGSQAVGGITVTWVDAQTLTVDLPALGPGIYDLWVINPDGQQSVRVGGIRVGKQGYLPLVAR